MKLCETIKSTGSDGQHRRAEHRIRCSGMIRVLFRAPVWSVVFLAAAAQGADSVPDARSYGGADWSPYLVGACIGLLVCLTMFFSNKAVGASSAYATVAGLIGKALAPRRTAALKYYQDHPPRLNWELIFVGATAIGALLAAWQGGELTQRWLPPMWADRFGENSLWWRALVAGMGGVLMSFGARMAGGCTSGHGISGAAQLNVGSWMALICFFVGGVAVAHLLF